MMDIESMQNQLFLERSEELLKEFHIKNLIFLIKNIIIYEKQEEC